MTNQSVVVGRRTTRTQKLVVGYEVAWQLVTGVTVTTGLAAVAFAASAGALLALWLTLAAILTTSWMFVTMEREFDLRHVLAVGTQTGAGMAAFVGLTWLLGWSAMMVAALLIGGSPPVLRRLVPAVGRRWPSLVERDEVHAESLALVRERGLRAVPAPDLVVTEQLTDDDLCISWRSSYVALLRASTSESRTRVVEVRATILDELERRNPPAIRAWLESGARAAGDPLPHLRHTADRSADAGPHAGTDTDGVGRGRVRTRVGTRNHGSVPPDSSA